MVPLWETWSCLRGRRVTPRSSLESSERSVNPDLPRPVCFDWPVWPVTVHARTFPTRLYNVCRFKLTYVHRGGPVLPSKTTVHYNGSAVIELIAVSVFIYRTIRDGSYSQQLLFVIFSESRLSHWIWFCFLLRPFQWLVFVFLRRAWKGVYLKFSWQRLKDNGPIEHCSGQTQDLVFIMGWIFCFSSCLSALALCEVIVYVFSLSVLSLCLTLLFSIPGASNDGYHCNLLNYSYCLPFSWN